MPPLSTHFALPELIPALRYKFLHLFGDSFIKCGGLVFLFPPVQEGPQGTVIAMHATRIVAGAFKPQQVFPDVVGDQLLGISCWGSVVGDQLLY